MSGHSKNDRSKLVNLAEFLTEDIPSMNRTELKNALAEEGLSESAAIGMTRAALESATREMIARRFAEARMQVAKTKPKPASRAARIAPARSKEVLADYYRRHPGAASAPTTMAARKGSDMPDETAWEIVIALIELGEISDDGQPL